MSKLQINMNQSELLMAIRCILNCQNEDIIGKLTEMKEANGIQYIVPEFKTCFGVPLDDVRELIERDKPKKLKKLLGSDQYHRLVGICGICGQDVYWHWEYCPYCANGIDWSE